MRVILHPKTLQAKKTVMHSAYFPADWRGMSATLCISFAFQSPMGSLIFEMGG